MLSAELLRKKFKNKLVLSIRNWFYFIFCLFLLLFFASSFFSFLYVKDIKSHVSDLIKEEQKLSEIFLSLQTSSSNIARAVSVYLVLNSFDNRLQLAELKNEFESAYEKYLNFIVHGKSKKNIKIAIKDVYDDLCKKIDEIFLLTDKIEIQLDLLTKNIKEINLIINEKKQRLEIKDNAYVSKIRIYLLLQQKLEDLLSSFELYMVRADKKRLEHIYDIDRDIKALLIAYVEGNYAEDDIWLKDLEQKLELAKEFGFDLIGARDKRNKSVIEFDANDKALQFLLKNKLPTIILNNHKELQGRLSTIFFQLIIVFFCVFLIVLIIAAYLYFITNKIIISPISGFTKTVKEITDTGDFTKKVFAKGTIELIRLSESFNKMIRGIVEREKKIEEEKNLLNIILTGVDNAIVYLKDNKFVWVNKAFSDVLGWRSDELKGNDIRDFDFLKIDEIFYLIKDDIEKNGVSRFEYSIVNSEAKRIPCFVTISSIDKTDILKAYIISIVDISHLREKEVLIESSINNMMDAFLLFKVYEDGNDARLINCNKMARKMFGFKSEYIIGKSIFELLPEIKENGLYEKFIDIWRQGKSQIMQNIRYQIKDEEMLLEISVYRVMQGFAFIVRDIAERELMQKKIIHYDKLAAIGQIAAGVAHEVGNPLTSINSIIQFLRKEEKNSDKKKDLELVQTNIERIVKIIRQVVDYSTVPKDLVEKVSAPDVIKNVLELVKFHKKFKGISITTKADKNLPEFFMDTKKLEQVILNVLLNAADALVDIEDKKINIDMKCKNDTIYIKIKDNGIGMNKETLSKVLDPFFTTKKSGQGSGLGLTISYNIIQSFGGDIKISSVKDKGTTISLEFPVETGD